jgi:hypothetical protein
MRKSLLLLFTLLRFQGDVYLSPWIYCVELGMRQVASCCVVGVPGVPCFLNSFTRSPSPLNTALSARSIVVQLCRARAISRSAAVAAQRSVVRAVPVLGAQQGLEERDEASSRGPDKAFLFNKEK